MGLKLQLNNLNKMLKLGLFLIIKLSLELAKQLHTYLFILYLN